MENNKKAQTPTGSAEFGLTNLFFEDKSTCGDNAMIVKTIFQNKDLTKTKSACGSGAGINKNNLKTLKVVEIPGSVGTGGGRGGFQQRMERRKQKALIDDEVT